MDLVKPAPSPKEAPTAASVLYLSFMLAGEEFAFEIRHVREIRGIGSVTPLPNAPPHLKGVMNLRGNTVPVIDLRLLFGLPPAEYGPFTVIVVLSLGGRTKGFVVDSVSDVTAVVTADIEATADLGLVIDASIVSGITRVGERFIALVDIERLTGGDARDGVSR